MNLELIKKIYADFCRIGWRVKLKHVSAHVYIEGNELADRMAMYAVDRRESEWRRYLEPIDIKAILRCEGKFSARHALTRIRQSRHDLQAPAAYGATITYNSPLTKKPEAREAALLTSAA